MQFEVATAGCGGCGGVGSGWVGGVVVGVADRGWVGVVGRRDRVHQRVGCAADTGSPIYVQGTIQGDDVDDDVPVTIDVFDDRHHRSRSGYEQADMPSVVDVGPSGFSFTTSNDLDAVTFPHTEVDVYVVCVVRQRVRHAAQASAALNSSGAATASPSTSTNSNPVVGVIDTPAVFTGGDSSQAAPPCSMGSPQAPPPSTSPNPPATPHPPTATPPAPST